MKSNRETAPGQRPGMPLPGSGLDARLCGIACAALLVGWPCLAAGPALAQSAADAGSTPPEAVSAAKAGAPILTLAQAYAAALSYDPVYRAAGHETEFARQGVPLARAALLPSLNLSASRSSVEGSRRFPNGLNQEVRVRTDYDAPQETLQLRVPVFNWDALNGYKISQVQSEVAELTYSAQALELLDRVAEAYIRALAAEESRAAIDAQVTAIGLQLGQAEQRLRRGEGTRVQVAQLQASLDLGRARKVESDAAVELAARQLQRLTGLREVQLQRLSAGQGVAEPPPDVLADWIDRAVRQSAALRARARAVDAARLVVRRQYAGHLPRLDLVATLSRSENDSISTLGQTLNQRSVGVQLNIPLYSGGGVEAGIRQAQARQARADEELREEREAIELDVQRFFHAVSSGARTVAAYRHAVASAELAWQGARRALEMGLGTTSDAAEAQAAYFGALRDLAQARSDHLLARVRLMARAGQSADEITTDIDGMLAIAPAAARTR